ncbi:hypothetical protein PM022_18750 [Halorubrum ezzemoulense]|uniref:hypothetical protein n=1 Tax=Halorubrum ezzemoulense TaxID=337243 RepID=UPI00232E523C|nr:hypothetical protein [Halorubrum ezzemoulense]MDB2276524.1 hypothetical protein [Halorubrum ezzemoulense]
MSVNAYSVDTDRDGETELTQGTRITRDRFTDIQSWMSEDSVTNEENDRFEPNDDFISATPVTANTTLTDLQIANGEFDYFAVELSPGDRLTADSTFDTSQNLNMVLYGPDQTSLGPTFSETDGKRIKYNASRDGTHYIAMYGIEEASVPYSLSINISESADTIDSLVATRTINSTTLLPGESATVTVTTDTAATNADLQIQEEFRPQFGDVAVTDDDTAATSRVINSNGGVVASWSEASNVTLVYDVSVPDTVPPGTTYNISGTVEDTSTDSSIPINGDTTIEVSGACRFPAYSRSDCTVGAGGLVDAAADFRAGNTGTDVLFDVASAFRSGNPLWSSTATTA